MPSSTTSPRQASSSASSSAAIPTPADRPHPPSPPRPVAHDPPGPAQAAGTAPPPDYAQPPPSSTPPPRKVIPTTTEADGTKTVPTTFEKCDMDDLIALIASMLNRLISHNDLIPLTSSSLTRFHSRAPPSISVSDYLQRITRYTNVEPCCLLILLYYVDRVCESLPTFTISSLTVHRFIIAGVAAGSKALSDQFCTNGRYARVGGVSLAEMNLLEKEFLKCIDWRLTTTGTLLSHYYVSLVRSHGSYRLSQSDSTTAPTPDSNEIAIDADPPQASTSTSTSGPSQSTSAPVSRPLVNGHSLSSAFNVAVPDAVPEEDDIEEEEEDEIMHSDEHVLPRAGGGSRSRTTSPPSSGSSLSFTGSARNGTASRAGSSAPPSGELGMTKSPHALKGVNGVMNGTRGNPNHRSSPVDRRAASASEPGSGAGIAGGSIKTLNGTTKAAAPGMSSRSASGSRIHSTLSGLAAAIGGGTGTADAEMRSASPGRRVKAGAGVS